MKISVIIPTYKRPLLLVNCLRALDKQHLQPSDFEVIVIADGPDPVTLALVNEWRPEFGFSLTFLQAPAKIGPAATRNMGWQAARAELIAFTDDDCLPGPNWLLAMVTKYEQEEFIAYTGKTIVPLSPERTDFANNTAHLQNAEFITANCACTKKALLQRGGFDERYRMAWREDSDLHFGLISDGLLIVRNEDAIVTHPVRSAPWGISIREQKKGMYDALLFKKYPEEYRERIQRDPNWNYYITVFGWGVLLVALLNNSVPSMLVSSAALLTCFSLFFYKRVRSASRSPAHLFEMAVTSLVIPFLSLFWKAYGCLKFQVLFL
jgi:glycosyltransferase involved in cell wall biosynthesis